MCQTKMRYYRKFAPRCDVAPNLVSRIFSFSAASAIAYLSATYFNLMLVTYHPTTGERAQGVSRCAGLFFRKKAVAHVDGRRAFAADVRRHDASTRPIRGQGPCDRS